jgi:hypothetical protein
MDEAVSATLKKRRVFTTDQQLRSIIRSGEKGRWRDTKTKCLYLESHDGRTFHWVHVPRRNGKTTYHSYGGYPAVPVAEARERAAQTCLDQRQGKKTKGSEESRAGGHGAGSNDPLGGL